MAGDETDSGVKMTPMMVQYQAMRRELPDDVLLLFRLGDFYEMFFDDAKIVSPILNVALTKRNGMPMCGVPHHAAEGYLAKLIRAGKRVALAEQTTDADLAATFGPVAESLESDEATIVAELLAPQGSPADIGGYYRPDVAKADAAMRPSATFNATIDALR